MGKTIEPGFRKPLRRLVALYGGNVYAVAKVTGLNRAQIHALLKRTQSMVGTRQAILFEQAAALKGAHINRVEFFPELFRRNPDSLAVVEKMIRSRR